MTVAHTRVTVTFLWALACTPALSLQDQGRHRSAATSFAGPFEPVYLESNGHLQVNLGGNAVNSISCGCADQPGRRGSSRPALSTISPPL